MMNPNHDDDDDAKMSVQRSSAPETTHNTPKRTVVTMILVWFCFSTTPCVSLPQQQQDMQALLAFKSGITEDPYHVTANWSQQSADPCNWTAVFCSQLHHGRVERIILPGKKLVGSLAPEIANLSLLQVLNLSNNSFAAPIPSSFGRFAALKHLVLQQNTISGSIPHEIGNISTLVGLDLSQNNLTGGIPTSIGRFSKLVYLRLSRNRMLGGKLPVLANLESLQDLSVYANGHTGIIPSFLCNWTRLASVDLSQNKFTGTLPECIGTLASLRSLVVTYNMISGEIVQGILNCTRLESLQLSENKIGGRIPLQIGSRLTKLKILSLSGNRLTGIIPPSFANITGMTRLALAHNFIQGHIPLYFSRFSMLESLDLSYNEFEIGLMGSDGEISELKALSNCSNLYRLQLDHNNLTGALPSELGKLGRSLQFLTLSENFVNGNIADATGNLSSLLSLDLSSNKLGGEIPASLAKMTALQELNLSDNRYYGSIPSEFVKMNRSLTYLYLDANYLSGPIPTFISALQNLRALSLSRNDFSSQIPQEIGECLLLETLDLSGNRLSGQIPEQVANLQNIHGCFNLSNNVLNGQVPAAIGRMELAECIDLSNNKLSGNIAEQMTRWLSIKIMNLSFNSLTGSLPKFDGLVVLEVIDLSVNNFTGSLPDSIYELSHLDFLNFSSNNFDGAVQCQGSFKRLTKESFLKNPKLCGSCLGLVPCPKKVEMYRDYIHIHININVIKYGGAILGCSIIAVVLTAFAVLQWRKNKKSTAFEQAEVECVVREQFIRLSREDLSRITANFSDDNLIGKGTYSRVYRGYIQWGMQIAVKVFNQDLGEIAEKSFATECKTLRLARHRNLVRFLGALSDGQDFKALIMELMPNGNLDSLLHAHDDDVGRLVKLSMQRRVQILHGLASGLCYLHHDCSPPVVHCDIKPKNVLLDSEMVPRLTDFGLAQLLGPCPFPCAYPASTTMYLAGTVGYVAPEYGIAGSLSTKGDVYSFGAVVLEVLTRMSPTDPIFCGNNTLRNWVSKTIQGSKEGRRQRLTEIVYRKDKHEAAAIAEDEHEKRAMEGLAILGLWCTSADPNTRPNTIKIESFLAQLLSPTSLQSMMGTLDDERLSMLCSEPAYISFYPDNPFDSVVEFLTLSTV